MRMPLRFRLQEKRVHALEETYESWRAEHLEAMEVRDTEELIAECLTLVQAMADLWHVTWQDLTSRPCEDLDAVGRTLRDHFDSGYRVVRKVLDFVDDFAATTQHTIEGRDALQRASRSLAQLRDRVMAGWPWSNRPVPPINWDMVEKGREARERGEYASTEEILARLRADDSAQGE